MIVGVADTHAALWLLFGDERLSIPARNFIDEAAAAQQEIGVSAISLAEVLYLSEKKRVPVDAYEAMNEALTDPDHVLSEVPLTAPMVAAMHNVSREQVPDMPDRIIAATSLHLKVPLITCDGRIQAAISHIIW